MPEPEQRRHAVSTNVSRWYATVVVRWPYSPAHCDQMQNRVIGWGVADGRNPDFRQDSFHYFFLEQDPSKL
jgi:hypothetical protein